ncbi:hypothetical protein RvY_03894 [Ramazzottius varieornatus]|uniref:Uncharacterized protein n=1 Tax=Ramazzottius varieornatus TaxID=947166 RepID=A0A1D1UPP6_RAMVA|nr:hypothetical protein RvY_03894 [Ramazzottius varieornatus]
MAYNYLGGGGQPDVKQVSVPNATEATGGVSGSSAFPVLVVLAIIILSLFAVVAVAKTIRARRRGVAAGFELSREPLTRGS